MGEHGEIVAQFPLPHQFYGGHNADTTSFLFAMPHLQKSDANVRRSLPKTFVGHQHPFLLARVRRTLGAI